MYKIGIRGKGKVVLECEWPHYIWPDMDALKAAMSAAGIQGYTTELYPSGYAACAWHEFMPPHWSQLIITLPNVRGRKVPRTFKAMRKVAKKEIVAESREVDPSIARYKSRALVRPGD